MMKRSMKRYTMYTMKNKGMKKDSEIPEQVGSERKREKAESSGRGIQELTTFYTERCRDTESRQNELK